MNMFMEKTCHKCKQEIVQPGDSVTFYIGKKFCECNNTTLKIIYCKCGEKFSCEKYYQEHKEEIQRAKEILKQPHGKTKQPNNNIPPTNKKFDCDLTKKVTKFLKTQAKKKKQLYTIPRRPNDNINFRIIKEE